jgi:hypothetical protein
MYYVSRARHRGAIYRAAERAHYRRLERSQPYQAPPNQRQADREHITAQLAEHALAERSRYQRRTKSVPRP